MLILNIVPTNTKCIHHIVKQFLLFCTLFRVKRFLEYSKAFNLIIHDTLLNKTVGMEVPAHLVRWMAAFLLD